MVNLDPSNGPVTTDSERLTSVPRQYRTDATTPLKTTVAVGPNVFDLDIPAEKTK